MPKKEEPKQKDKAERVRDSIEILQNLKGVGIHPPDLGYEETKKVLDTWIQSGEGWSGKIEFLRYGRVLELILPTRADRKCTSVLKATEELKRQWNKEGK